MELERVRELLRFADDRTNLAGLVCKAEDLSAKASTMSGLALAA